MNFSRVALLLVGTFAIGCSSDSPVAPTRTPADLNLVLKEASLPAVAALAAFEDIGIAAPNVPLASACAYTAASQSFVCPTVTAGATTITHSFVLLDASGKPQPLWGSTIAAVRVKTSTTGATRGGDTQPFDLQQELTVSGLLTGIHVLDGSSTVHIAVGKGNNPSPQVEATTTIVSLVLPEESAGSSPYPKSGTITTEVATTEPGGMVVITVQVTFNGTSKAETVVTLDGSTQRQRCTIDLPTNHVLCE